MGHGVAGKATMSGQAARPTSMSDSLLTLNNWVTTIFVVATAVALTGYDSVYAVLSALLFFAGGGLFLLGFWNAVQRSRQEIVNLPVLLGFDAAAISPHRRWKLWIPLLIVVVVALVGAAVRPFTQQAFGILAPMFQLGVMVLWTSRHARFEHRE